MASKSANDLCEDALVDLGVHAPGEAIPAAKLTLAYNRLVEFLESFPISVEVLESFNLVAGTASYTYGDGEDFNSQIPLIVKDDCQLVSGDSTYQVRKVTLDNYRSKKVKGTTARPQIFAVSHDMMAYVTVYFYPTPDSVYTFNVRASKYLVFLDRTTSFTLAGGLARAIRTNLAVEMAPAFGRKVSDALAYSAKESRNFIEMHKMLTTKRMMDVGAMAKTLSPISVFDINSGPFGG